MTRTLTLLAGVLFCIVSLETFAQSYRLIGYRKNTFNTAWTPDDSSKLLYSNGRGGGYEDYYYRRAKFDTSYNVNWDGSAFVASSTEIKTYDQYNRPSETTILGGTGINHSHQIHTYDQNDNNTMNVSQTWQNNAWQNSNRVINTYDVNNNFIVNEQEMWDNVNGVWKPWYKNYYDYDMNNNRTKYLRLQYNQGMSQFDTIEQTLYHYTNNLCDTSWQKAYMGGGNQYRYVYVYQNNVRTNSYYFLLQGTWQPTSRTFMFYQGVDNIYIGDSTQVWNIGIWKDSRTNTYNIDNNNDAVSNLERTFNLQTSLLENSRFDTMVYNNGHQITWQTSLSWDNNTSTFVPNSNLPEYFYYYEQYTNEVKTVNPNAATIEIFPSPARDNITLRAHFDTPEDFKVKIYDMQGRLVMQTGEKATKEYNKNIQLNDLASGNYIIQLKGSRTNFQQQFTIMK